MKLTRRLLNVILIAVLVQVTCGSASAGEQDPRHSLEFHGADLPGAIALIGAEFGVRMVADGSVPHVKAPDRIPEMTLVEVLSLLKSYGLDYVYTNGGGQPLYTFSAADWLSRAGSGRIWQRTMRYASVDDKLLDWLRGNLPAGTSVYAIPGSRRVVVVGSQEADDRASALLDSVDVSMYDQSPGTGAFVTQSVQLKYTVPSDVAKKLGFGSAGSGTATAAGGISAGGTSPATSGARAGGGDSVIADDHAQILVLSGDRDFVADTERKIALLDVPAVQGQFNVQIFAITKSAAKNLGILWQGTTASSSTSSSTSGSSTASTPTNGGTTWSFSNWTIPIMAQINALVDNNNAKLIATTQILVSANKKATLKAGERYPFPVVDPASGVITYQEEDVGVIVDITPTFAAKECVFDVHLEDSDIIGTVNNQYPLISEDTYDGPGIRLGYDQTLVLGGLMKTTTTDDVTRVPLLSSLPLIGAFFRNRNYNREQDELMFLFTPHVST